MREKVKAVISKYVRNCEFLPIQNINNIKDLSNNIGDVIRQIDKDPDTARVYLEKMHQYSVCRSISEIYYYASLEEETTFREMEKSAEKLLLMLRVSLDKEYENIPDYIDDESFRKNLILSRTAVNDIFAPFYTSIGEGKIFKRRLVLCIDIINLLFKSSWKDSFQKIDFIPRDLIYYSYSFAEAMYSAKEWGISARLYGLVLSFKRYNDLGNGQFVEIDTPRYSAPLLWSEYLKAYNLKGLSEVNANRLGEAYFTYQKAIKFITSEEFDQYHKKCAKIHSEPRCRDCKYCRSVATIYQNLAYLCSDLANNSLVPQMQEDMWKEALQYIDHAQELYDNGWSNQLKADIYYALSKYNEAFAYYKMTYSADPALPYMLLALNGAVKTGSSTFLSYIQEFIPDTEHGISQVTNKFLNKIAHCHRYRDILDILKLHSKVYYKLQRHPEFIVNISPVDVETARNIVELYELLVKNDRLECYDTEYVRNFIVFLVLVKIYMSTETIRSNLAYVDSSGINSYDSIEELWSGKRSSLKRREIAYYTTLSTLRFLLNAEEKDLDSTKSTSAKESKGNHLTMMHAKYMNDPNEGLVLFNILGNGDKGVSILGVEPASLCEQYLDENFVFLKSFTDLVDQLNMWVTYGSDRSKCADSNGCCVCIAQETFDMMKQRTWAYQEDNSVEQYRSIINRPTDDFNLYRVVYIDKEGKPIGFDQDSPLYQNLDILKKQCRLLYDGCKSNDKIHLIRSALTKILSPIAYLFKDASYCMEKELRLVLIRHKSDLKDVKKTPGYPQKLFVQPPHQIYVDKIILGPKVENKDEWIPYLQMKLQEMWDSWPESYEIRNPVVRKSEILYR